MLKGTMDYFAMNFYTSYYVSAPTNNLDPTMVRLSAAWAAERQPDLQRCFTSTAVSQAQWQADSVMDVCRRSTTTPAALPTKAQVGSRLVI